jgi:8-amino-7-oxononanoate synthase
MTKFPLEVHLASLLDKRRRDSKLRSLKSSPPGSVDLSSNDFLSLSSNPDFRQDYLNALTSSPFSVGSTGSRLLDGNSTFAEAVERDLAVFHGAQSGLLTNSGFDANVSIFTCLPQPGDVIVYDELIHASVHDGMRQSRAKSSVSFKHNDVEDLRQILDGLKESEPQANVFVAVESVYSMEGDLAPLSEIADLLDSTFATGHAHLIVDEAHATGIYGTRGGGRVSELGLEGRVSIRLHTFGKALACNGAIILCSPTIRLYLINYARPLIYTTFMSYPSLMAIHTAYQWLSSGKADTLSDNLNSLIQHLYQRLQSLTPLTYSLPDQSMLILPRQCPQSPIFALLSTKPRELANHCQSSGFVVRAVVPPTVPDGTERVRVCLHAGNTVEQIDRFVECVAKWVRLQKGASEDGTMEEPTGSKEVGESRSTRNRTVQASPAGTTTEPLLSKL